MNYGGAVFNGYLRRYMSWSTAGLNDILNEWDRMSRIQRLFAYFSLLTNYESRNNAIRDILEARKNPAGEAAQRINWKIESWSQQGVPVGA